jgi:hypothetical protein
MQMESKQVHVCLELAEAPAQDGEYADGTRWVCFCGTNFVYREGFNRAGFKGMDWWEAPPIATPVIPEQRQARRSLRDRLIPSRKG